MKTANFPRAAVMNVAGRYFPHTADVDDWLISITDYDGVNATVYYPFDEILYMQFDDTDDVASPRCISLEQAEQIANFIKKARDEKKNVWVNCHAGICRSGAIASLLKDLGWEYVDHAESPGRIPNSLVYNRVRAYFEELRNSWEQEPTSDIWVAAKGW